MCVLLIDLRPDAAPLPGMSVPSLSLSKERTLLLAEGLKRMDFSAVTLCFARSALARECAERGLPVETLREGLSGLGLYLALRRIVSRYAVRVVHLFGFEALGQAAWLRRSRAFWLVVAKVPPAGSSERINNLPIQFKVLCQSEKASKATRSEKAKSQGD